jgi:ATP-dependent exoDNAse (exonuclease V) beta subunit
VGRAIGTALHRLLEHVDLGAEPRAELSRQREAMHRTLEGLLSGPALERAREGADALLERIAGGSLFGRLRALAADIVARELPVLLPPGDEGPVGFVSGVIDLVYRDPDSGELVVADYKTDRVEGEAALDERRRLYAPQAEAYRRALHEALGLAAPPRFELWFLAADRITVEP